MDFVRDYVFKNIGFQIYYLNHLKSDGTATIYNYTDSFFEYYIKNYNIKELINLKWFFTALFVLLFGVLGSATNAIFYENKKVIPFFFGLYIFLFGTALLIYTGTYLTNSFSLTNKLYLIAMEITHLLQSSLPTLLFLVSFKLYKKSIKS